jgi:hypothetical protein
VISTLESGNASVRQNFWGCGCLNFIRDFGFGFDAISYGDLGGVRLLRMSAAKARTVFLETVFFVHHASTVAEAFCAL